MGHRHQKIVVERLLVADSPVDLRTDAWGLALDQRAFGPRRLVVALGDRRGRLVGITHADRTDPPELALACCLVEGTAGAATAVAYCDEPVAWGPPPADLAARFAVARLLAAHHGIHLVDWFACDDHMFRSTRFAIHDGDHWWDVP